ncbi:MAG: hypothetical protein GKR89_17305 [Candidatus Latescibacteria bacterium]|nr:hypothetical protein [Candidatus Latescibacterota bacterium]
MIRQGILVFEDTPESARLLRLRVAGISLLDRAVRTMQRVGLKHILVLLPATARPTLDRFTRGLPVEVEFATWGAVPPPLGAGNFLLLMGDHVHHHSSLSAFVDAGLGDRSLVYQTSQPPEQDEAFYQVEAATGALQPGQTPEAPTSTGAFLCAAGLFTSAELSTSAHSPWSFLQQLAGSQEPALEPAPPLWRRVSNRRGARAAKKMLFGQVTKPTSGFVSRHLNARLSIPTSKLLIGTGISPHLVTVFLVLPTGLLAAYLVTFADHYPTLALSGLLWHLAAVFDRCDGEIARVKLCETKFGAWFDTVTDNLAYLAAGAGIFIGMGKLHPDTNLYLYSGLSTIGSLLLVLGLFYFFAMRRGSGSLQNYLIHFAHNVPEHDKGLVYRAMERYGFIAKRDFWAFVMFLGALSNMLGLVYWYSVALIHLVALGMLLSLSKMLNWYKTTAEDETGISR